jgi:hypothetical protein
MVAMEGWLLERELHRTEEYYIAHTSCSPVARVSWLLEREERRTEE